MKKRKIQNLVLFTILLIFVSSSVLGLGIRPVKTNFNGDEIKHYEGTFWIVNDGQRNFDVHVVVEGEMEKFVSLENTKISFREDDEAKPVNFMVDLPEKISPGNSVAAIIVEETLISSDSKVLSSKIKLKHKVNIQGEYPDKYVEYKINFHNLDDKIEVVSEVKNLGKQDIEEIQTKFYVNNKNQEIETKQSQKETLKKKETKLLKSFFSKDSFDEGEYEISAVVFFDGLSSELTKIMRLGEPNVEITYFDRYFKERKVNPYNLDVHNKWNKPVENVYVDVVLNQDGQELDSFRTKSVDIDGQMTKKIQDYFDARARDAGKYTFDLVANYWNTYKMKTKKISYDAELFSEKEFEEVAEKRNIAGQAISAGDNLKMSNVLFWIPLIILILVIGIYMGYRYAHKDDYEGGDEAW